MRIILILIFAASISFSSEEIGRYALFQGYFTAYNLKSNVAGSEKAVFKIDTKTGEVWKYDEMVGHDGKFSVSWVKVK